MQPRHLDTFFARILAENPVQCTTLRPVFHRVRSNNGGMRLSMVTILGRAKINLTLDILGLRGDGYHEIATVMQSLALADTLTLSRQERGITLTVDMPGLEADERNLAHRAAALIIKECDVRGGVHVDLAKRIPVAAGLAGGSADAAATLRGMNELYALGLSDAELCSLGAQIGSDIPFSLMGGTVFATGRGEVMQRLADFPMTHVVLAKPPVSVSTPWAYRSYDAHPPAYHPDNVAFLNALAAGDTAACAGAAGNVLEPVTERAHPVIGDYRARLRSYGAFCAMMSGSGPTVFGLFAQERAAEHAAEEFCTETDAAVYLTRTAGKYGG